MILKGLKPIIDESSKVIILGSFPSNQSLEEHKYYANPRNQFWKLIYSIFDKEVDNVYDQRIKFLLDNKIALWDVFMTCDREGSLDSRIRKYTPNDFNWLLSNYPNLKYVFFNGAKAEEGFKKTIKIDELILHRLPSSSSAWAIPFEEKRKEWEIIIKCLNRVSELNEERKRSLAKINEDLSRNKIDLIVNKILYECRRSINIKGRKKLFKYLGESKKHIVLLRDNGNEVKISIEEIKKAVQMIIKKPEIYWYNTNKFKNEIKSSIKRRIYSPLWAIIHLVDIGTFY